MSEGHTPVAIDADGSLICEGDRTGDRWNCGQTPEDYAATSEQLERLKDLPRVSVGPVRRVLWKLRRLLGGEA